jgi:transmembrane sensor
LAFRDRRLGDLINEMNRYSKTQLHLGDSSLAGLQVSGSFHAGDQDALAKALARGWQLRVVRTAANELTLLPAIERQR